MPGLQPLPFQSYYGKTNWGGGGSKITPPNPHHHHTQIRVKINEIEAPASFGPLEAAEPEECPLNTLVSIPARFSIFIIHTEIVLLQTSLCVFT